MDRPVRGGRDRFSWEHVKTDRHRENYLGHSLKAPVGRWQKGKDLQWYAKNKTNINDKTHDERTRIQHEEKEMMLEVLGLKKRKKTKQPELDDIDVKKALERGQVELESERVAGLGYEPAPKLDVVKMELVQHPKTEKTEPSEMDRGKISSSGAADDMMHESRRQRISHKLKRDKSSERTQDRKDRKRRSRNDRNRSPSGNRSDSREDSPENRRRRSKRWRREKQSRRPTRNISSRRKRDHSSNRSHRGSSSERSESDSSYRRRERRKGNDGRHRRRYRR